MDKSKKFDCVKMKNDIQEKIIKEKSKFSSHAQYLKSRRDKLNNDERLREALKLAKDLSDSQGAA